MTFVRGGLNEDLPPDVPPSWLEERALQSVCARRHSILLQSVFVCIIITAREVGCAESVDSRARAPPPSPTPE